MGTTAKTSHVTVESYRAARARLLGGAGRMGDRATCAQWEIQDLGAPAIIHQRAMVSL